MQDVEHIDIAVVRQDLATLADRLEAAGYGLVAAHLSSAIDSISSLLRASDTEPAWRSSAE